MILFFVVFPTGRNFWDSENGVEKRECVCVGGYVHSFISSSSSSAQGQDCPWMCGYNSGPVARKKILEQI